MGFQQDPDLIVWKLHLSSPSRQVYQVLATNEGRAGFWAESAVESDGYIDFRFPDGLAWHGKILANDPPHRFALEYFGGSITTFELAEDTTGGTELTLTDRAVPAEDRIEVIAG